MIKDGLIQTDTIYDVPFKLHLIPKSNKIARPANTMVPEYLTVHNTGNSKKGADAEMHTKYVDTATNYVSWHFTVDDKQIIQELPINENAWHAGDGGNGSGNRKSIGIEICEHEGINWVKAKENAVKLIVFIIRNVQTLKSEPVVPHQKWSGKYCPHKILNEGWNKFMNQINSYKNEIAKKEITLRVNGTFIKTDVEPFIKDNRVMVPVRYIAEALGKKVDWDGINQIVDIK